MIAVWFPNDDRAHVLCDETSVLCGLPTDDMQNLRRFSRDVRSVCPMCARLVWLRQQLNAS